MDQRPSHPGAVAEAFAAVRDELRKAVVGQEAAVEGVMIALLSGGHALLTGPAGHGKTALAGSVARALGMESRRVQFTSDLLPGDVLGMEVLEEGPDGGRRKR